MAANVITTKVPRARLKVPFKLNKNKINLFLDTLILLLFAVEVQLRFTGVRIHELFGLAFAAVLLVHIVLHWKWIWNVTIQFFRKPFHGTRLQYILAAALLIDMTVITVTGIAISHTLGWNLKFGMTDFVAHSLHTVSSDLRTRLKITSRSSRVNSVVPEWASGVCLNI